MTRKLHSAVLVSIVLLSSVVGGIALGGSAAALDGSVAGTYPLTPGSETLGTAVMVARPGDAVAQNGIQTITLDFGADSNFDGSVQNVTDDDVFIAVRGGQRIEIAENDTPITELSNISVSSNRAGDRLTITLPRPVTPQFASDSPNTGAEVSVKFDNFTTPSQAGEYTVQGSLTDPSGTTDGPVSMTYSPNQPELTMSNQSLSQFSDRQTLNFSAATPGGGYVGVFTTAQNGSPDRLVGSLNTSPSPSARNYTVDVTGNISESQQLVAVAYTESEGRSAGLRADEFFDPAQDDRLTVNGQAVNATASVSTLDVDGQVAAGNEYNQGQRLYFAQGEPETAYQVRTVEDGELGSSATQFQTAANGTAILDTGSLDEGQYAISRVDDGSLVSLDNDSTTGPQDDSFFVSGQQATTTASDQSVGNATTDGGAGGAATDASTATADESDNTAGGNGSGDNGSGDSSGGSGAFGPGFGVVVAVVALLGAALLAARR